MAWIFGFFQIQQCFSEILDFRMQIAMEFLVLFVRFATSIFAESFSPAFFSEQSADSKLGRGSCGMAEL